MRTLLSAIARGEQRQHAMHDAAMRDVAQPRIAADGVHHHIKLTRAHAAQQRRNERHVDVVEQRRQLGRRQLQQRRTTFVSPAMHNNTAGC
jgi:hypothetical protein